MTLLVRRLVRALTRSRAATRPDHPDPRLQGRRYGLPFEVVWREALRLADGALPRWTLVEVDEGDGLIRAESRTRVLRFVDDVEIRITLDGQDRTRVDMTSASRVGSADLGQNARRIARFQRRLDDRLYQDP